MIYNVMDINTIEYKGKKYIVRDVESEDGAYIEIGSKFLSKALITPDGDFVDDEAERIDCGIYGYLDDTVILNIEDDEEFLQYVYDELG